MYSSSYSSMDQHQHQTRRGSRSRSISATKSRLVSTSSAMSYNNNNNRNSIGSNSNVGSRSSSTPLAALADKFEKFKRRIKSSSSKKDRGNIHIRPTVSDDSRKSLEFSSSSSMDDENSNPKPRMTKTLTGGRNNVNNTNRYALAPAKGQPKLQNRSNSSGSLTNQGNVGTRQRINSKSAMDVDEEEGYINSRNTMTMKQQQQHDAAYNQVMEGMIKMSSSSDATTVTANSTQPSFSIDDGSTIVSEDTTSTYTYHSFPAGKEKFTVDKRYNMIRTIGSGAYGVVISAKDFNRGSNVAIKMVPRAFHDEIDAKRILREIKLLKHFRHENIISILDMMPPLARNVEDFTDVYIVTDLMETDLHRIIYSKQSLSIDHVQYFLYQVLRALKYMHSANVLHRDLKPSNLLVNSNCDLKVCDFGLARGITSAHDRELEAGNGGSMLLTEYVVTRWYRAPEIMLSCHEYSKPSDVWSVGCIFAELLGRKPFFPGDDYIHQVRFIFLFYYNKFDFLSLWFGLTQSN